MSDRLTQLQDMVNKQADNFTNSLGILQQCASPTPFNIGGNAQSGASKPPQDKPDQQQQPQQQQQQPQQQQQQQQHEDHTSLFAQLICRNAKDIEVLIESLPSEESSAELQAASLQKLEAENAEAAKRLSEVVTEGEGILKEIQAALHDIATAQLNLPKQAEEDS